MNATNSPEGTYVRDLADPLIAAIADDVWDAVKNGFKQRFWDQGDITWYKITMVRLTQRITKKPAIAVQ